MARANPPRNAIVIVVAAVIAVIVGMQFIKTVPPGRVGVATLFGNVQPEGFAQGQVRSQNVFIESVHVTLAMRTEDE